VAVVYLNCALKALKALRECFIRRIVMLHSFIKKSQKTPLKELKIAQTRMREIKNANP
jgi:phage-related protein